MDTQYVRLTNSVTDFGKLIPLSEFENTDILQKHINQNPKGDWYSSLFIFNQDAKNYFEKNNNSIKGFNGKATTKILVFDFDSKIDLSLAKEHSLVLLEEFQKQGIDVDKSARVFFSGNKGFHIELYTTKEFTPDECKDLGMQIKRIFKLSTLDTVIYNTTRLYRITNTINPNSNLYKIELDPKDLVDLTVEQIKERAKEPVKCNFIPTPTNALKFLDIYKTIYNQKSQAVVIDSMEEVEGIRGLDTIDFNECPRDMARCIFALSKGIMRSGAGERNAIFLRLATFYRNQGMDRNVALNTLVGIAELNARLYPEEKPYTKQELENTVINSLYSSKTFKQIPGASGTDPSNELLLKYCALVDSKTTKKCCLHSRAESRETTVQIDAVSNSFEYFATNFDRNTIKTGINFIDDHMHIAIGTTTLLVGSCGSGKTTMALNIMENASKLNQHTIFFSLDMSKNLIYLKLAQKVSTYSQREILDFYQNKDYEKINEIKKIISERYEKVYFDFSGTLTLEQMRDKIFKIEDENKVKIKLVVIDYASRVSGPYSDTFANANYNALKSTEMATITDSAWIFINQISRNTGDGITPLRTKRAAKDSGSWEESSTNVITIWRPFLGAQNRDDVIRLFLAKNRIGQELEQVLRFDGAKGIIRDLSFDELADYAATREKDEKDFLKNRINKF